MASQHEEKPISPILIVFMWVIFMFISIPLTILACVITLPYKLYLIATRVTQEEAEMLVQNDGPRVGAKDDLLFIHGFPDTGYLWKNQFKAFS